MTAPSRRPRVRQRLLGLAATLVIAMLVAGIPVLLIAIGAAPWHTNPDELRLLLSSPDDGTLAMTVIAAVAWIAWFVVAASVVLEIVSQVRGLPAPTLPGLSGTQRVLGQLVAMSALLFVAAPVVVAAFPAPPASAVATAPVLVPPRLAATRVGDSLPIPLTTDTTTPVPAPASAVPHPTEVTAGQRATIEYTVKRGDSLWRIAERLLGDGTRFTEIVDLNRDTLHGQPDFITAGTVLQVPDERPDRPTDANDSTTDDVARYVVKSGDTLWGIADRELGDPLSYPELFEASQATVQPDGAKLTDPNLLRPGWTITIPDHPGAEPDVEPTAPAPEKAPPDTAPPVVPKPSAAPQPPFEDPAVEIAPDPPRSGDTSGEAVSASPRWLVPGLTGGGAVLAALVLLTVRAHRNTQLRYRRPGERIEAPPIEVRSVEKTAFTSGTALAAPIEHLGRALLQLAGTCQDNGQPLPELVTAKLSKSDVTLQLAADAELQSPWSGQGRQWSLNLTIPVAERGDVLPPYPLLVTVGQDDSGDLCLVNLEHLGVISLAGAGTLATALARHIAAELALNPWSVVVKVTLVGVGEELSDMDVGRLTYHRDGTHAISSITEGLTEATTNGSDDPDPFRVVLTTGDGTVELASLLEAPPSRLGAAVVSLAAPVPESTVFTVDEHGRLRAPVLNLDLHAAGLSSEDAAACAAIVDLTRECQPEKIAPFAQAADGWLALADQAGALRDELTHARGSGPAGDDSLLPAAASTYAAVAATTADDVETLAPIVPQQARRAVESADPHLDEDLADWFAPDSTRPRLWLLGPVHAEAHGVEAPAFTKRKPYFVELLTFLALHPEGSTGHTVADAFSVATSRVRTDLGTLRDWLGDNPRTGQPYLPQATKSPAFRDTGIRSYQVEGLLVDLDLFRRLRLRGEARGTEGIADLKAAMALVEGVPFSTLRERGWSWLLDDERIHETIGCSIVDTAHILIVDALARDDLDLGLEIAETACRAAPCDDICRLDLAKVLDEQGHHEAADQMLHDEVFNRTDDQLPPIELPTRTGDVTDTQRWSQCT